MDMSDMRSQMFPRSKIIRREPIQRSMSLRYGIQRTPRKTATDKLATVEQFGEYCDMIRQLGRTIDPNAIRFGPIFMAGIINTLRREIERERRKDEPARTNQTQGSIKQMEAGGQGKSPTKREDYFKPRSRPTRPSIDYFTRHVPGPEDDPPPF